MTSIITNEIEERYPYPDNGDCPIAHESGKAMDDSEREWWVNLAASAWTLIDGTEETE